MRVREEKEALEHKKFPSILKVKQMGVKNFKPTILHRILYMGNGTKDTVKFEKMGPKVETTWPGGIIPKYDPHAKSANYFLKNVQSCINHSDTLKTSKFN